jgi:hypothetical protein
MTDNEKPRFGVRERSKLPTVEVVGPLSEWSRLSCRCDRTTITGIDWWFAPLDGRRYGVVGCSICNSLNVIDTWGATESADAGKTLASEP